MTARVIWTSSIGADDPPPNNIEFEMLDNGTTSRNWILAREFAHRYNSENILSVAANPENHTPRDAFRDLHSIMDRTLPRRQRKRFVYYNLGTNTSRREDRKDIIKAMTPEEDGGLGCGKRFWDWCEEQWEPVVGKVVL
ncbi:hypothetical protein DPV78_009128 [Talaromyces pinophilus]|nr:hypothetical protein DPV78_009128 [Talaromyces pinophilus]